MNQPITPFSKPRTKDEFLTRSVSSSIFSSSGSEPETEKRQTKGVSLSPPDQAPNGIETSDTPPTPTPHEIRSGSEPNFQLDQVIESTEASAPPLHRNQPIEKPQKYTYTLKPREPNDDMVHAKIRTFRGQRNGTEDPEEFLEDLDWAYEQDYASREPEDEINGAHYKEKTYRILFRQNLDGEAYSWYTELDSSTKRDWTKTKETFLKHFAEPQKDEQSKKFELRMKLANLKQADNENIADYTKRTYDLFNKLPNDDVEVGMATLRGMRDNDKKGRITFECSKDEDFTFATVQKLIKAAYSEIGRPSPFDHDQKNSLKLTLPATTLTNEELLRQTLLNQSQLTTGMMQAFRSINMGTYASRATDHAPGLDTRPPRKDLSTIKCFVCNRMGHYASECPNSGDRAIAANAALPTPSSNLDETKRKEAADYHPTVACLLPLSSNTFGPAMAATRSQPKKNEAASKTTNAGVSKSETQKAKDAKAKKDSDRLKANVERIAAAENEENEEPEDMVTDDDFEEAIAQGSQSQTPPAVYQPPAARQVKVQKKETIVNQTLPTTRVSKTGKVQELVQSKSPKVADPIRGMSTKQRFDIGQILDLPIQISVGEFLDRSDVTIKELAYNMQRATPRYRVKRPTKTQIASNTPEASGAAMVASTINAPNITAHAFDDDGNTQPLMVTAWVGDVKFERTLIDGGSIVEIISSRMLKKMSPPPHIHHDGHLKVSLATDVVHTLTNYVLLPINVAGVQAVVKAWIVDNQVYDLLLGISWMRRVAFHPNYGTGRVTITGNDGLVREMSAEISPLTASLPTVEIEDEDDELAADAACQLLLDEQENPDL